MWNNNGQHHHHASTAAARKRRRSEQFINSNINNRNSNGGNMVGCSQESNGSSCVIGYGPGTGTGQEEGQQLLSSSPWLLGEMTMTLTMDQEKFTTSVTTGNANATIGDVTTGLTAVKGNENNDGCIHNINKNGSIESSQHYDDDDEELILKGRRKRNNIRNDNYELQQDNENGQGGTFADLEQYLIDNQSQNHTQQLSNHDHIDTTTTTTTTTSPADAAFPQNKNDDENKNCTSHLHSHSHSHSSTNIDINTSQHCNSIHRQHYQQQPLLESPTAACTNTDIDINTGIDVDTATDNTDAAAERYGYTYNNSQHGITHQMLSTRNQTHTRTQTYTQTSANHNRNKPQSIHVLQIIEKQKKQQKQQQLQQRQQQQQHQQLNQGSKSCTPSQQHSRALHHTSRNSNNNSNNNTVFQDEFASRLIRNNTNTVKRKTSASTSALKSTSIRGNDDLFSTSRQQPTRTPYKDPHSHFAKRTIENDDIGLSSYRGRGRQTSISIQGSANKTPRRILGAGSSASASPKRRTHANTNANSKSTTPVRVLTQSQKLAAATQSSTMLLRTGTRTRTKMSMSRSNMNMNSASAPTHSFPNTFDCLSAKKALTSWPKWDTKSTTGSQDGMHGGHGTGQECNNDDLEPSFGPSFLSNKKRKIPRMDNVADEEDDGDNDINIDHNGGTDNDNDNDNDNDGGTTRASRKLRNEPFGTPRRDSTSTRTTVNNSNRNNNNTFTDGAFRSSPQPVTPKKSARKSKKNKGPFSRMLHSIRASSEADRARFHSGNYPYRQPDKRRHDVNDPRNRAETIMDMTVISHPAPIGSGESASIVAYVHQHVKNDTKIQTMRMPGRSRRFRHVASELRSDDADADAGIDTNDDDNDSSSLMETEGYALVCFTRDLFVDLAIEVGSKIRIYNAQIINREVVSSGSEEMQGRPVVVCTNLCEVYPSELPPLSVPG